MIQSMQSLFSQQELDNIDQIIDSNVSSFFDGMISNSIDLLFKKEMQQFKQIQSQSLLQQSASECLYEIKICDLFNLLNEQRYKEKKQCEIIIDTLKNQTTVLASIIESKETEIKTINLTRNQIKKQLIEEISNHQLTKRMVYELKQELIKGRDKMESEKQQKNKQIFYQKKQIQNYLQEIKNTKEQKEKLQKEKEYLIIQKQQMQKEFDQICQELSDDLQKYKTNLMTLTIFSHQMTEKYQDMMNYFNKSATIHQQNKEIVSIILKINQNLHINFTTIQQMGSKQCQNIQHNIEEIFDSMTREFNYLSSFIHNYSSKMDSFLMGITTKDKLIVTQNQQIGHLCNSELKLKQELIQTIKGNEKIAQQLKLLKQTNYKMLIDSHNAIAKSHQKLQECEGQLRIQKITKQQLLTQMTIKTREYQIALNTMVNEYTQQKVQQQKVIQELDKTLKVEQSQNQSLIEQLKQSERRFTQLNQEFINTKGNLQIMIKTQSDDDNTNFSLIEQLIEKNTLVAQELASKKQDYETLKLQKYNLQIEITEIKLTLQQSQKRLENLAVKINQKNQQLTQRTTELNEVINQQLEDLSIKNEIINGLQTALVREVLLQKLMTQTCDECIQTEQNLPLLSEAKIRKQNIMNKSVKSEIQKSHSLLSEREENKQNVSKQNCYKQKVGHFQNEHKLKLKPPSGQAHKNSCKSSCEHKQKIVMLNQIINYMVNHVKGYSKDGVRDYSWLNYQILCQGSDYQRKIIESSNMMGKINTIRRIAELCSKQMGCRNLILDFESIMNYYFNLCQQTNLRNLGKQKLGKTINKFRKVEDSQYY